MLRFGIDINGTGRTERYLADVGGRMVDMAPGFEMLARSVQNVMGRQFNSDGAYLGQQWEAISEVTQRLRNAHGITSVHPLQDTGALRNSLTSRGNPEHHELITPSVFEYGSKLPYASVAQYSHGGRRLIMPGGERVRQRWVAILANYIMDGLAAAAAEAEK